MSQDTLETLFARKNSRFDDALNIQQGASNLRGISRTLNEACLQASADGVQPGKCPAVQLIVHQMCHLATIFTSDYAEDSGGFNWLHAYKACCEKATFETLHMLAERDDWHRTRSAVARQAEQSETAKSPTWIEQIYAEAGVAA